MSDNQTTEAAKLEVLAGPPDPAYAAKVQAWMRQPRACRCDAGALCHWPNCERIGNGIGHYP